MVLHPLDHEFASLSCLVFDLVGPAVAEHVGYIAGTVEFATLLVAVAGLVGSSCIMGWLFVDGSSLFVGFQLLVEAIAAAGVAEFDVTE